TADSVYIFIDNSNVYVQGKKETAWREIVKENLVQIDYDSLWKYLRKELGYNVFTYNRNFLNREKEVDLEVSICVCNTIAKYVTSTVILIAGDGDYGPVMRQALDSDWTIELWFWTEGQRYNGILHSNRLVWLVVQARSEHFEIVCQDLSSMGENKELDNAQIS
ncbi:11992_t:CDS:2, partial [Funneliformis geosporum]